DWNELLEPWTSRMPVQARQLVPLAAELQGARTSEADHLRNFLQCDSWRSVTDEDGWLQAAKLHTWISDMFRYGYAREVMVVAGILKTTRLGQAIRRLPALKAWGKRALGLSG